MLQFTYIGYGIPTLYRDYACAILSGHQSLFFGFGSTRRVANPDLLGWFVFCPYRLLL
jgi:hypothetical protein